MLTYLNLYAIQLINATVIEENCTEIYVTYTIKGGPKFFFHQTILLTFTKILI